MIDRRNSLRWTGVLVGLLAMHLAFAIPAESVAQEHDRAPIELSGFSISEAFDIADDLPLDVDSPLLKQLLYRIRNTSPESRLRYSDYTKGLTWQDVSAKTEDFRLWTFDIPARLTRVEKQPLMNLSSQEDIQHVFVCHCETTSGTAASPQTSLDPGRPFLTLATRVPREIPVGVGLDEPIRVVGFLYARISGIDHADENEMPVFISDRIAWYPSENTTLTSANHKRLAGLGFDIGLLDDVRDSNNLPLGGRDAEAFYQMLAAVGRLDSSDNSGSPSADLKRIGFKEMVQNAGANFGECAEVSGTIRSCSVITVPQQDIRERLGVETYYQLMLFPDLDGARVVVRNKDGSKLDYRRFPITVCCTELPDGLTPAEMERQQCVVNGFYYRFWKYQSEHTDQLHANGQVSPLILAQSPQLIESSIGQLNAVLLVFVIGAIAIIFALIMGFRIADRRQKTPGAKILDSLPDKIDASGWSE